MRESPIRSATNRNKRSITLDLAKPEGQQIVRRPGGDPSDVGGREPFKVGDLKRYGLDQTRACAPLKPAPGLLLGDRLRPERSVCNRAPATTRSSRPWAA